MSFGNKRRQKEKEFRQGFLKRKYQMDYELRFGYLLRLAELYPQALNEPYRFLLDSRISRQEKISRLNAEYPEQDERGNVAYSRSALPECLFDKRLIRPTDFVKAQLKAGDETLSNINSMIDEAYSLVERAKGDGFETLMQEFILGCCKSTTACGQALFFHGHQIADIWGRENPDAAETIH